MYDSDQSKTTITTRKNLYGFDTRDIDNRRSEGRKTHDIKQLWQLSHEILNLASRGFKNVEIAEILNITPQTVSNTINSELGMKKLSEIREERDADAKKDVEKIRVLKNKALQIYDEILGSEDTSFDMKKKVADTVTLDLAGLKAPTKIQTQSSHLIATPNEIEEFKKRGLEAAKASGLLVELEPQPGLPEVITDKSSEIITNKNLKGEN